MQGMGEYQRTGTNGGNIFAIGSRTRHSTMFRRAKEVLCVLGTDENNGRQRKSIGLSIYMEQEEEIDIF